MNSLVYIYGEIIVLETFILDSEKVMILRLKAFDKLLYFSVLDEASSVNKEGLNVAVCLLYCFDRWQKKNNYVTKVIFYQSSRNIYIGFRESYDMKSIYLYFEFTVF
jgi:hypothetical protein